MPLKTGKSGRIRVRMSNVHKIRRIDGDAREVKVFGPGGELLYITKHSAYSWLNRGSQWYKANCNWLRTEKSEDGTYWANVWEDK